jgi:hypothetical protein
MPRKSFVWVVWLILTVTAVNTAYAFLPICDSFPHSPNALFLTPQLILDDMPLGEDVAVPGKGERESWGLEQQSKYIILSVHRHDIASLFTQTEHIRRADRAPVLPVRIWFPRKLSSSPGPDEPFLS